MSDGKTKKTAAQKLGLGCFGVLALLLVIGIVGSASENKTSDAGKPTTASTTTKAAIEDVALEEQAAPSLTGPQANARRSAEQYISMSGFSRKGLINQLSSDAGEGFAVADATAAVDSLDVNWNEQAARSAKQYLEMSGFSCKGLIQQLSSSAGEKFTKTEAAYGAKQAGAC